MKFVSTSISGVWIIQPERHEDDRGWFARTWCEEEFAAHGLPTRFSQCNASFNKHRGTLRGMHFQEAPHQEAKLVRCTRGSLFDVALDLRPGSPTFGKWEGIELTEENGVGFFIPEGCAHGFQTLEDATEVFYSITTPYHPESLRGARWDDPRFSIQWPLAAEARLNERDASYPHFVPSGA